MHAELFLAIETSAAQGGVAMAQGGEAPLEVSLAGQRRHTADLVPVMAGLLKSRGRRLLDVSAFCFSAGPGSFTGLRIAAAVARVVQSASACRVARVSTLETIARNAMADASVRARLAPMLDAKSGSIFAAVYERGDGVLRELEAPALFQAAEFIERQARTGQRWLALGEGVRRRAEEITSRGGEVLPEALWTPRAARVLEIGREMLARGEVCPAAEILPIYLRPPECEEVYEQRRAEAVARRSSDPSKEGSP